MNELEVERTSRGEVFVKINNGYKTTNSVESLLLLEILKNLKELLYWSKEIRKYQK